MSQQLKRQKTIDMAMVQAWGKLVPLSSGLAAKELDKDLVVVGRVEGCDLQINDKRLSSKHCQIAKRGDKVYVIDLSTNGTYIKDNKIGKGNEAEATHEAEIWLLPPSRVKPTEAIGFRLELTSASAKKQQQQEPNKLKTRSKSRNSQKSKDEQKKQQKPVAKTDSNDQSLKDQITCAFCFEVMYIPVSIQPCNHRFCGACLTDLVNSKKGDCIKCRKPITTAVKDASFNSIIDLYLKNHPEDKRDPKEMDELVKKNIFTFDPTDVVLLINGKPAKKKAVTPAPVPAVISSRSRGRRTLARTVSDLSASDDDEQRCRECMAARNGFQCAATQRHVPCLTCAKLIADRNDPSLHQNCVLCTQYFCNLYYPPCVKNGVKLQLVQNRKGESNINKQVLRGNQFQFQSLRNHLLLKKMTSKQVFDFVLKKMEKGEFSYICDRKIMKAPPIVSRQVKMNPDDAVCDLCWRELWFQMVFFFRREVDADLPRTVRDRPACYWGINCNTMEHKQDHAKRYNHMLYQTRF